MIDPRLAWFAIGATCSAVVFGWPWHPRFSRHRGSNPPPPGRKPAPSACPPVLSTARWLIINPAMYAECGGPCEAGPEYCDCGQVRLVEGSIIPRGTRMQDPDWRRSINHENINRPSGPPPIRLDEGRVQRGNGSGGPTTQKPRIIPRGTRSISYPDPGPDRQPTNPFTGKPVEPHD